MAALTVVPYSVLGASPGSMFPNAALHSAPCDVCDVAARAVLLSYCCGLKGELWVLALTAWGRASAGLLQFFYFNFFFFPKLIIAEELNFSSCFYYKW